MTRLISTIAEMRNISCEGAGFVPTMGYLHEGHAGLMRKARKMCGCTVVSIFVNPIQFGAGEDFERYPRDLSGDMAMAEACGIDYLFVPQAHDIYPPSFSSKVMIEGVSDIFCGQYRPGHFSGVATVVLKLLNIVRPSMLFLGQKDFQQTVVIKKMINDFNIDTEVVVCPTARTNDGLALSSRNSYLSESGLETARLLYKALKAGERAILNGERDSSSITAGIKKGLADFTGIDYVSIADPVSLEQPVLLYPGKTYVILAAVWLESTRLIDNIMVSAA